MKENQTTNKNCDERTIALRLIDVLTGALEYKETLETLYNSFVAKIDIERTLAIEFKDAYATIRKEKTDDLDLRKQTMMDFIMIIVCLYGGAISARTLDRLLGQCGDEYYQALQTIVDVGMLECSIRNDGEIACFYIPIDQTKLRQYV